MTKLLKMSEENGKIVIKDDSQHEFEINLKSMRFNVQKFYQTFYEDLDQYVEYKIEKEYNKRSDNWNKIERVYSAVESIIQRCDEELQRIYSVNKYGVKIDFGHESVEML